MSTFQLSFLETTPKHSHIMRTKMPKSEVEVCQFCITPKSNHRTSQLLKYLCLGVDTIHYSTAVTRAPRGFLYSGCLRSSQESSTITGTSISIHIPISHLLRKMINKCSAHHRSVFSSHLDLMQDNRPKPNRQTYLSFTAIQSP